MIRAASYLDPHRCPDNCSSLDFRVPVNVPWLETLKCKPQTYRLESCYTEALWLGSLLSGPGHGRNRLKVGVLEV